MKKMIVLISVFLALTIQSALASDKLPYHLAGVAIGDALGGYTAVTSILYAENDLTKAAGYVNIGLLAAQAAVGILSLSGVGNDHGEMITAHKIIGYTILAASIWLSVSTSLDNGVRNSATPYTSYGYTAICLVPIIVFSF